MSTKWKGAIGILCFFWFMGLVEVIAILFYGSEPYGLALLLQELGKWTLGDIVQLGVVGGLGWLFWHRRAEFALWRKWRKELSDLIREARG